MNVYPVSMMLKVKGKEKSVDFNPRVLIIAGFTGKDRASAEAHLKELAEMGIPVPEEIPSFYPIKASLATQGDSIEVTSSESSGEAEPVLITTGGSQYIAVGSDHTARDLEKVSIAESKGACRKPLSNEAFDLDFVKNNWNTMELRCYVERNGKMELYQDGPVSGLTQVEDLEKKLKRNNPEIDMSESVMFLGTVSLLTGSFVYGSRYRVELIEKVSGQKISHEYGVMVKKGRTEG